jgi:hypothetical protein
VEYSTALRQNSSTLPKTDYHKGHEGTQRKSGVLTNATSFVFVVSLVVIALGFAGGVTMPTDVMASAWPCLPIPPRALFAGSH